MKSISHFLLVVALGSPALMLGQEKPAMSLSKTIPLPEVQGGFNHMSADAEHGLLFATATTAKTVEIVDVKSGKVLRSLAGDGPAAALFASGFNQLYVTRGRKVCIYDGRKFELLTNVELPSNLDELGYHPGAKELYVGCMSSNHTAVAIIGIPDSRLKAQIRLPAKPQGFVVEQKGSRIFANIPSLKQVAVLDRQKQTLVDSWSLKDSSGNYPIALDETNDRLFVGCRRPAELLVLDAATGKSVARVPIGSDTDDLSYDAKRKRIYIACGEGYVDVVEQRDADHYQMRDHIGTPLGSRNSVISSDFSGFYLAVPQRGDEQAEIRVFQPQD